MAQYHIGELNKEVMRNPILTQWMIDKTPRGDFTFRYAIDGKIAEILHGGLFSFKRGLHVNGALIADDILRDPDNPLAVGKMNKIEDHFMTESLFIPLKGVPVIVLGTPMMPGDLLTKLKDDDRFKYRMLPALDPVPGRRVLMPELYSEDWLLQQQKARPKSFASEFMLVPHFSTESYFDEEDIVKCEDATLRNVPSTKSYEDKLPADQLFAGFDVGKKRHPSHLVIFKKTGDRIEQIHSSFLDGWSYSDQIAFLNEIAENFNIDKGYIDNTRGELEDRGMDSRWYPMHFTLKNKNTMAQVFEKFVHSGTLHLIADERQRQQILSVSNELKAPDTPMGHGDAFFSIALALMACHETAYKFTDLGNATDWLTAVSPGEVRQTSETENEVAKLQESIVDKLKFEGVTTPERVQNAPNPVCQEALCNPSFWVGERNLCLYCGHRG